MISKNLQALFEDLIEYYLMELDYQVVKDGNGEKYYSRYTKQGHESIVFIFGHYGKMLSIKPKIGLYFTEIGDIYKKNTQYEHRPNICIGNHLLEIERYIKKGETTERVHVNHRWKVKAEEQVVELI